MRIYLTGRVTIEGVVTVDESRLPGPLGRVMVAVLALSRGPISRGRLADILWDGNPAENFDRSLNPLISRVRSALVEAGMSRNELISGTGSLELRRSSGLWVDLDEAVTALDQAEGALRRGDPRAAWPRAAVATSILGRPFLEGIDLTWVAERRRLLADLLVRAYEATVDVWLRLDDPSQAVQAATRLVAAAPFRETSHVRLIRAHLAGGNRAAALVAFGECERILRTELGVEPSAIVQTAYEEALAAG